MIELVRRAAIVVLWIWIAIGVIVGELARPAPRPLTSSKARGLEWRAIRRVGPRVVAVRLQVVFA